MTSHSELEKITTELETLRKEYKTLGNKVQVKYKLWEKLLEDHNKQHSNSVEWLINNPDTPGQYESLKKWTIDNFGGEYLGVQPSGYNIKTNQQCFDLLGYTDKREESYDDNIRKFFSLTLGLFKPNRDGLVRFGIGTGEFSGIHYITYKPETETWGTISTQWSRDKDYKESPDFETALTAAWAIKLSIED